MQTKVCPICGKVHTNAASKMCYKHYMQMKKYGKIICANSRTVFDMNEVRVLDDYCEIDTYDQFGRVFKTFKFDKEDLPIIYAHKWQCTTKGKNVKSYYLVTTINKQRIYFHRLIMNNPSEEIDHINIDSTDNRRSNLRIADRSQQLRNTRKRQSVSKYKGVYYSNSKKRTWRWHAELQLNSKRYYSPWYATEEEAIYARYILEQIFKVDVHQDADVIEKVLKTLPEDKKSAINKCLLNKFGNNK